MSVRPSRVRFSQPPGSVTTEVEQSTERRISESGEVKGVCPESAPLAPRDMILEKEPILSNRAQAKRKMRYRRAWTVTLGSQTASSRSTTLEQPGVRRVSCMEKTWRRISRNCPASSSEWDTYRSPNGERMCRSQAARREAARIYVPWFYLLLW